MPKKTILLIGQGLAGTFLSMRLNQLGVNHTVISNPKLSQSSEIAAGLINPIVLKRLKWVKHAETYSSELPLFYPFWEQKLSKQFFFAAELAHLFKQQSAVNDWHEKSTHPNFKNHLGPTSTRLPPNINTKNHGWGLLKNIFWVNTSLLLQSYQSYLLDNGQYEKVTLPNEMSALNYYQQQYQQVIVCTGHLARNLIPSLNTVFTPTKGEVMVVEAPQLSQEYIWHSKVFALPLGQNKFKVGATYSHDNLSDEASPKGLDQLKTALEAIYNGPYEVLDHKAGVRPNIKDRQPILGNLKENLHIFNGLGSRGTLMGPYLTKVMGEFISNGKSIPPQWDVKRFI